MRVLFDFESWGFLWTSGPRHVAAAAICLGADEAGGTPRWCGGHVGGVATFNGNGDVVGGHDDEYLSSAGEALNKEVFARRELVRFTVQLFFLSALVVVKQKMLADDELLLFGVCVLRTVLGLIEQNLLVVDGAVKDGFVEIIVEGLCVLDEGILKLLVVAK